MKKIVVTVGVVILLVASGVLIKNRRAPGAVQQERSTPFAAKKPTRAELYNRETQRRAIATAHQEVAVKDKQTEAEEKLFYDACVGSLDRVLIEKQGSLTLSPAQHDMLVRDVLTFLRARQILNAERAKVSRSPEGLITISTPSDPEGAVAMSEAFMEQLATDFGKDLADKLDDYLGEPIMSLMDGYGIGEGKIEISPGLNGTYSLNYQFMVNPQDRTRYRIFLNSGYMGSGASGNDIRIEEIYGNYQLAFLRLIPGFKL